MYYIREGRQNNKLNQIWKGGENEGGGGGNSFCSFKISCEISTEVNALLFCYLLKN